MENLKIRQFQQAIINFINQSDLPIEVKRLCLNDITAQVNAAAEQQVYAENSKEMENSEKAEVAQSNAAESSDMATNKENTYGN